MDFKEQKLKEFTKRIFNKTFSRDGKIYWDEVESFIRKALVEQEKDFENIMKVYHDNYYELEKRLRLSEKEVRKILK